MKFSIFKKFSSQTIQKTTLNNYHRTVLNGKMVNFEGFDMPVQYSGIIQEHFACRNNAAIFDVSHMGQVKIYGKDAIDFLESLCVSDLKELKEGSGTLTTFTNEEGGIIDDSIVTNMGNYVNVVFNAGRKLVDLKNLDTQLNTLFQGKDVIIEHLTNKSLIAFQGPKSSEYLQKLVTGNLGNLGFMEQAIVEIPKLEEKVGVMRCGYTGEDGFEISVSNEKAEKLFDLLYIKESGILPAGLGSRDTLRLEAGLCLYGHDLNEKISPVEAKLNWLIGKRRRISKGFKGADVIIGQLNNTISYEKVRVGFKYKEGPPAREGALIYTKEGEEIGRVCSGTQSPVLKENIGQAYIKKEYSKVGTEVLVKVRNNTIPIKINKMPFVPSNYYKKPQF